MVYTRRVRHGFALLVALLTVSVSGISTLVVAEPCTAFEQPGREDGACPPTCVTCGCCAQAVEPVTLTVTSSFAIPLAEVDVTSPALPRTTPRDILHVPKTLLS